LKVLMDQRFHFANFEFNIYQDIKNTRDIFNSHRRYSNFRDKQRNT